MTNCYSDNWIPDHEMENVPVAKSVELSNDDPRSNPAPISNFAVKPPEHWMDNNDKSDINTIPMDYNRKDPTKVYEAFTLEEIVSSDLEQEDAQKQIVKPDEYEEADSSQTSGDEVDEDSDIAIGIRRLSCQDEPRGLTDEQISRYIHKKKKWRAQLFKRRRSQSFGDEVEMTESVEVEGLEVDHIHRRLRRRITNPDEGNQMLKRNAAKVEVSDLDEQMEVED